LIANFVAKLDRNGSRIIAAIAASGMTENGDAASAMTKRRECGARNDNQSN